jgi:hypothetical protein
VISKFKTLLPVLISVLIESLKSEEELGKSALESFIDISQYHPEFLKDSAS